MLEQAVSRPPGNHCPLLWRLYLALVAATRPKGLKNLTYRALVHCPGVKVRSVAWWTDGLISSTHFSPCYEVEIQQRNSFILLSASYGCSTFVDVLVLLHVFLHNDAFFCPFLRFKQRDIIVMMLCHISIKSLRIMHEITVVHNVN